MTRKTTKTKKELVNAVTEGRDERRTLAEGRDKIFEKFYTNVRILCALQTISMVDLSREMGMKSGKRLYDLSYGRGTPSTEELMALAKKFNCTMDDLLTRTATVKFID